MKLKFGEKLSIDYKNTKALEKLEVFNIHECDCEHCTEEMYICPYCKSIKEPKWLPYTNKYSNWICICSVCKKKAFRDSYYKRENQKIIDNFEKNHESKQKNH